MPCSLMSLDSVMSDSGLPCGLGKRRPLSSRDDSAASSTSKARRDSGTWCSRFAFMRAAGIVHTWAFWSTSVHCASRTSPERRCQHQELEGELRGRCRSRGLHGLQRCGHLAVRQRAHVLHHVTLAAQCRPDAVARVVGPEFHGHGPLHYGAEALEHASCGLWFLVPDGCEDLERVGRGDFRHGAFTAAREHVSLQACRSVPSVLRVAPTGLFLFEDARGGIGERRDALGAAFASERVAAGARELAVGEGRSAGLLERYKREAGSRR